jgi:hypothetical protein
VREDNLYQRGEIYWLRAEIGGREFRESLRTSDVKSARRLSATRGSKKSRRPSGTANAAALGKMSSANGSATPMLN